MLLTTFWMHGHQPNMLMTMHLGEIKCAGVSGF